MTTKPRVRLIAALSAFAAAAPAGAETVKVDPGIKAYEKVSGVAGNLNSIGSDTLNNLMTFWVEGFQKQYPNVGIQVEGKGSSTAPPALISGTAQLGPMSREMKASEIDDFEGKYGYKPVQIRVAIDALAVFVNKDNPIQKLTLDQVDAAFSKGRKRGGAPVATWGDLGATGGWAGRPLSLYGRNSASGTYGFFKEHVLKNGDYRDTVKEQPGSASVVQSVTEDKNAIGYSGIGYSTSGVRPLMLAEKAGEPFGATDYESVMEGKYPITRFLYIYINKAPNKPLDPLVREFIAYVLSREGQEAVIKDGYFPIPAAVASEELAKIK